jgi:Arc/MetJ family transcription regulator
MNLNESLLKRALELTGLQEKTAVVHAGLEALIALESARRLAKLGGSMPDLELAARRRSALATKRSRHGSGR